MNEKLIEFGIILGIAIPVTIIVNKMKKNGTSSVAMDNMFSTFFKPENDVSEILDKIDRSKKKEPLISKSEKLW